MHIRFGLLGGVVLSLSACATNAPVERVARDTFLVRTHVVGAFGGGADAQARNAERATKYCAGRGQKMTILQDQTIGGFVPQDTVTFRCGDGGPKGAQPAKGA